MSRAARSPRRAPSACPAVRRRARRRVCWCDMRPGNGGGLHPQPDRRHQHQLADLRRVGGGKRRGRGRAPGPADQRQLCYAATRQDEVDGRADVAHRFMHAGEGRVGCGRLRHGRGPGRAAVAADVERIDVVTAHREVTHPAAARQLDVEGAAGGKGRSMHEEHDALGRVFVRARSMLVAQLQFDTGVRRDPQILRPAAPGPPPARTPRRTAVPARQGS